MASPFRRGCARSLSTWVVKGSPVKRCQPAAVIHAIVSSRPARTGPGCQGTGRRAVRGLHFLDATNLCRRQVKLDLDPITDSNLVCLAIAPWLGDRDGTRSDRRELTGSCWRPCRTSSTRRQSGTAWYGDHLRATALDPVRGRHRCPNARPPPQPRRTAAGPRSRHHVCCSIVDGAPSRARMRKR